MNEEIMKTKMNEELLLLVRNASGATAYAAGEEIKRRLAAEQSVHLTALRCGLWVSICVHIITGFVLLCSVFGGR